MVLSLRGKIVFPKEPSCGIGRGVWFRARGSDPLLQTLLDLIAVVIAYVGDGVSLLGFQCGPRGQWLLVRHVIRDLMLYDQLMWMIDSQLNIVTDVRTVFGLHRMTLSSGSGNL